MNKNKIIGIVIILILIPLSIFFYLKRDSAESYLVEKVSRGDILVTITATGTVLPENRLEIKPPIAGRIDQMLVKEGQLVKKGQILAWMSSTERAALLDAARAKGEAEYQRWQQNYKPTPVLSPVNGTIILKNMESGQTLTSADAIVVISNRLTVKAQVDETDIAQIKLNQASEITLDAYPKDKIPAKVSSIAFEAVTTNNVTTYSIEVAPEKTPDFMRSGMTANVTFNVNEKKDVLLVPTSSIRFEKKNRFVLTGKDARSAIEVPVETGISDGKYTEVKSGVNEGDNVFIVMLEGKNRKGGSNPLSPMGRRGK